MEIETLCVRNAVMSKVSRAGGSKVGDFKGKYARGDGFQSDNCRYIREVAEKATGSRD